MVWAHKNNKQITQNPLTAQRIHCTNSSAATKNRYEEKKRESAECRQRKNERKRTAAKSTKLEHVLALWQNMFQGQSHRTQSTLLYYAAAFRLSSSLSVYGLVYNTQYVYYSSASLYVQSVREKESARTRSRIPSQTMFNSNGGVRLVGCVQLSCWRHLTPSMKHKSL